MCRVARANPMTLVEPPRLGLDRVADPAPRPHEVVDVAPARPPTARGERSALAGQFASVHGERRPRGPRRPDSGANQGALFASLVTAGGPIVAPWNTLTVPSSSSQIQKIA